LAVALSEFNKHSQATLSCGDAEGIKVTLSHSHFQDEQPCPHGLNISAGIPVVQTSSLKPPH